MPFAPPGTLEGSPVKSQWRSSKSGVVVASLCAGSADGCERELRVPPGEFPVVQFGGYVNAIAGIGGI